MAWRMRCFISASLSIQPPQCTITRQSFSSFGNSPPEVKLYAGFTPVKRSIHPGIFTVPMSLHCRWCVQPSEISTPSFVNDFRISNVICAGDNITGTVMLHFDITPLYGGFRLYMGGERNGTSAFAKGVAYPSSDHYGRVYTMRGGQPEHVVVMFYNIAPGVDALDRVDISMGLALNTLNIITMRNIPIFWTYTDKAIRNFVREKSAKETANQNQNTNLK